MSEVKINFEHKGSKISLQGKREDRMKEIIEKLKMKIDIEIDKIYLLYNGQKINVEMKIEDIMNNEDKSKNEMNIIVYDIDNTIINENIKQSEDIICPECKKNTLIKNRIPFEEPQEKEMSRVNSAKRIIKFDDKIIVNKTNIIIVNSCYALIEKIFQETKVSNLLLENSFIF